LDNLVDYIVSSVAGLVTEKNQSLVKKALDASEKLLIKFAQDPQSNMLVINQFQDDSEETIVVRYTATSKIQHMKDQTLSVIFAKKKALPITDEPILKQLSVTL
jgi:hypothetical protein